MKKIKHVSSSNQSLLFPFSMLNHQVPGPNASHNGGGDQSDCHHLGNSSRGRGEPNQVLFSISSWFQFTLVPGSSSPSSLQGTHLYCGRQRSLSVSYDFLESNRGGTSKTVCSTLLFQLRRLINLCEKSIPMRHKGVHYIHLPFFVNAMFNFVKGILSVKIQNRCQGDARQNEILYLGSASTRAWMNWWKMFAVSKGFPRNTEAPFLCRQWPGEC